MGGGTLTVNASTGSFNVSLLPSPGFPTLVGSVPGVLRGGLWLSPGNGLALDGSNGGAAGGDGVGTFTAITQMWILAQPETHEDTAWMWVTTFKCYDGPAGPLTFEQTFPNGSSDSSGGSRDMNIPGTAFPSFDTRGWPGDLQLATFYGQNAAQVRTHVIICSSPLLPSSSGSVGMFEHFPSIALNRCVFHALLTRARSKACTHSTSI